MTDKAKYVKVCTHTIRLGCMEEKLLFVQRFSAQLNLVNKSITFNCNIQSPMSALHLFWNFMLLNMQFHIAIRLYIKVISPRNASFSSLN